MSSISLTKQLYTLDKDLFTFSDIQAISETSSTRTIEQMISRLIEEGVLLSLEKGKYVVAKSGVSDFEIAQFLYSPSYVSLESALNYYGILSQFPTEIISVTTGRTTRKEVLGKIYSYSTVTPTLFAGYEKLDASLVAQPAKAIFDYLYFVAKGVRSRQYLDEMDFSRVKKDEVTQYLKLTGKLVCSSIINMVEEYL